MKLTKVLSIALCAAIGLSTVTGCGNSAGTGDAKKIENTTQTEKTNITFWHSMGGVNGEALNYLVDKFNKENDKGIHVDAQYQGEYDDSINKLKSAQLGNMGADIVQIYDIGTRFMIDSGWIVPMQDLIDKYNYDVSKIEPNIAAYYSVDKKLYSMPFNSSTPILYYNKDMFKNAGIDKVPESFSQIEADSEALTSKGGAQNAISLGIYGWFFEQFICKQGLTYANNGNGRKEAATKVEFDNNGAALNILKAWKSLYDKGCTLNVGRGGDSGLADFSAGKSAMTLGSTASLKQILEDVNGKFEVGTAYFPSVVDGSKGGVSIGGASLWVLDNKDEGKQQATWEFIKFLVSPESQAYWNANTGYFPVTIEAKNEQVYKDNVKEYPQFQTAIDQLHDSSPEYAGAILSIFPEARQTVETEIENMLNGKQSPEDTVKIMSESINKSITEYNTINK